MEALPYLKESYRKDEERHFIKEYSDMIRNKRFKVEKSIFRVDILEYCPYLMPVASSSSQLCLC